MNPNINIPRSLFDSTPVDNFSRSDMDVVSQTKQKFKQFAEISSDWYWELNSELEYIYHSNHRKPIGFAVNTNLIGKTRIGHLLTTALQDDQLRIHNENLLNQTDINVILSWKDNENPDGQLHTHILAKAQFDASGNFSGYLGCGRDITATHRLKQKYEHQANHDSLTGLLNRRAFSKALNDAVDHRKKEDYSTSPHTLICVNLDKFKFINDSAGHSAGDQVLCEVSQIFGKVFCNGELMARISGDEFAVLTYSDEYQALRLTNALIDQISEYKLNWQSRNFSIGASAGIVPINSEITTASELLSKADVACYSAKANGCSRVEIYSEKNSFQVQQNNETKRLKTIISALENNEFSLYLQPIVSTEKSCAAIKFEVLLRLFDENGKVLSPGEFIPIAEKYDYMHKIDLWIVENALRYHREFRKQAINADLSINLSGNTLSNQAALNKIITLVESFQAEPGSLCFEITETAAIDSIQIARQFITEIKALGHEFSLDDFGSGLSSFSYLKSLQVDYLKIDGAFVSNILEDKASRAIVHSFNTLAHELNMKTVAEYVENQEIADLLSSMDIDFLQGFGIGKPRAAETWLAHYIDVNKLTGS